MKKALIITTFLLASSATRPDLFGFEELDRQIQHMHNNMKRMHKASHAMLHVHKKAITPHIQQEDGHLALVVDNVFTHNVQATLEEENSTLHIKTDSATIDIAVDGKYLSFSIAEHIEKQTTEQGHTSHSATFSSSASGLTLQHTVNLEDVQIDYDASIEQLKIVLPYIVEKRGKTIPVNIKK